MADIAITAANVLRGANAKILTGVAGATITAGQVVYSDTSDSSKFKLADANLSAATANPVGIALHGAANGQPLTIVTEDDDFTPGGTLSLSAAADDAIYVLSATAGGIAPVADLASGWYPVIIGVAKSATKMNFRFLRGITVLSA